MSEMRIPDDLAERPNWVCWRYITRGGGRPTKVPFQTNGVPADTTDPETWCSYDDAMAAWDAGGFNGVGYVFAPDDPFCGLDIDTCILDGKLKAWAVPYVERFADTYCEISPSGQGLKCWFKGKMPGGTGVAFIVGDGRIEAYDRARFFTVTGDHYSGYSDIEEHQTDLDWVLTQSPHGLRKVPTNIASKDGTIPKGQQHDSLVSTGGTMWHRGATVESIFQALWAINQNQCTEPGTEAAIRRIAQSFTRYPREHSPRPYTNALPAPASPPPPPEEPPPGLSVIEPAEPTGPDLLPQTRTDDGNAERLLAVHGEKMVYCPPMKKWLIWDGRRWSMDEANHAQELAVDAARLFLDQVEKRVAGDNDLWKFATKCLNATSIHNALQLASSRRVIMPIDLDAHPYALNCANGTIDLRTGELTPHRREDYITKLVHHDYDPAATCPQWRTFLDWAMSGGPDANEAALERAERLTTYLQVGFGYSITGITSEKALFILYGESGDNGKTTMSNTVRHVVREYSTAINIESLMMGHEAATANAQSDLADLRGARFVQTSEAQRNQRLDQSKLKKLASGGGMFKTCRKYENTIEFEQSFHIWLDTNPLPVIRDPDDAATMARLHPVPFTNQISAEDKDLQLPEKLKAEAPGILTWLVQGAKFWHENGLQKPPEVEMAREHWRSDQDQIGRFIEECCVTSLPTVRGGASRMYAAYKEWIEGAGERAISMKEFGARMGKLYERGRSDRGNYYLGVQLRNG